MKKRGQLNILIYAVISIVAVFALIIGYQAIKNITEKSKETMLAEFKNRFLADIAPLKYEDVVVKTYDFSSDVKTVCFIDKDIIGRSSSSGLSRYQFVKNSVESGAKKNVFLLDNKGDIINSFYTEFKIQNRGEDPEYYCEPVINGKATLKLGGKEKGLKGTAYNFEVTRIIKNGVAEIKFGGIILNVKDKGGNEGNNIKFNVTKKISNDHTIVSDEYDVQFSCDAQGNNCGDNIPSGIELTLTVDFPSCPEGTIYTMRTTTRSGIFEGKKLICEGGKLKLESPITT